MRLRGARLLLCRLRGCGAHSGRLGGRRRRRAHALEVAPRGRHLVRVRVRVRGRVRVWVRLRVGVRVRVRVGFRLAVDDCLPDAVSQPE